MTPRLVVPQYKARYGTPFLDGAITMHAALLTYQLGCMNQNDAARIAVHIGNTYRKELLRTMDARPIHEDSWVLVHRGSKALGIPTLWLLGWSQEHGTEVHDHADSEVGLTVLRGTLAERIFDDSGKQLRSRKLILGNTIAAPAPYIHDVYGTAKDLHQCDVSLHAYWPPLRTQTLFKPEGGTLVQTGCWKDDEFIAQQCAAYNLKGKRK